MEVCQTDMKLAANAAAKEVDKAVESAGQQIEKAGESIQGAAKGDKR